MISVQLLLANQPNLVKGDCTTKNKRLFTLLITISLVLAFTTPAFAAEPRGSDLGDIVIWLCASQQGDAEYASLNGHAWLMIHNDSDLRIPVGSYTMSPGETITLGAFNTRSSAPGPAVWVNLEAKYAYQTRNDRNVAYGDAVALVVTIDASEFGILSDAIDYYSDMLYYPTAAEIASDPNVWNRVYTCVNFALDVWNAVGGTYLYVSPKSAVNLWSIIDYRSHATPTMPTYYPNYTSVVFF